VTFGGYLKEVHVEVDPSSLLAHDLTLADVAEALRKSNRNAGGGFLIHGDQQLIVRGVGYVVNPSDIKAVVLKNDGGTPVTIGDVSKVLLSHTPRQGSVGYNLDAQAVEGFVLMRRGENPSVVLEGVHAKVEDLNHSILPKGMRIQVFSDRTTLVEHTLRTVFDVFPELRGTVAFTHVTRWRRALPFTRIGAYRNIGRLNAALDPASPVQYAADFMSAAGQNTAVEFGNRAARNLMALSAT